MKQFLIYSITALILGLLPNIGYTQSLTVTGEVTDIWANGTPYTTNRNQRYATSGDTITVRFQTSYPIFTTGVTMIIANKKVPLISTVFATGCYQGSIMVDATMPNGLVDFSIQVTDALNTTGMLPTAVKSNHTVTIHQKRPTTIVEFPLSGQILSASGVKIQVQASNEIGLHTIFGNLYNASGTLLSGSTTKFQFTGGVVVTSGRHEADFSSLNLPDGKYYFKANARDITNNINNLSNTVTTNFVVNSSPLTATVTYDPSTPTTGPVTATVNFNKSLNAKPILVSGYDGGTIPNFVNCNNEMTQCTFKHRGNRTYTIGFEDLVGNTGEAIISFNNKVSSLDTTPPTATITYNPSTPTSGTVTATLTFSELLREKPTLVSGDDKGTINNYMKCYDSATTETGANIIQCILEHQENSTYTIQFYDLAGNTGTKDISLSNIDTTHPTVTFLPGSGSYISGGTIFSFEAKDNVLLQRFTANFSYVGSSYITNKTGNCAIGMGVKGDEKDPINDTIYQGTFTLGTKCEDGKLLLKLAVKDIAGNFSVGSDKNGQLQYTYIMDNTAPTIKNGTGGIASGSVITGTVDLQIFDDNLSGVTILFPDGTTINPIVIAPTYTTGLTITGAYTITVVDIVGNITQTTFTVVEPQISCVAPMILFNGQCVAKPTCTASQQYDATTNTCTTIQPQPIRTTGGGGGGSSMRMDDCPNGDFSPSYYDKTCGTPPQDIVLEGEVTSSSDDCSIEGSTYSDEENAAYLYACEKDITTIRNIMDARLFDKITRAELAKVISQYAMTVLDKKPDTTKDCSAFSQSIAHYTNDLNQYMTTSCQLDLMGVHPDMSPLSDFMPDQYVTRAEFGTVFSRLLRGNANEVTDKFWYQNHLLALQKASIVTNIEPTIQELRVWIFLQIYRSIQK